MRYSAPTLIVSDSVFSELKTNLEYQLIAFNNIEAKNEEKK